MKAKLLIITNDIFDISAKDFTEILEIGAKNDLEIELREADEVKRTDVTEAEIIFGWPNKNLLPEAKNLKWIQLPSAGADSYADSALYYNPDFILTNSSGVYGKAIAEHVLGMIFAYSRNLQQYAYQKQKRNWQRLDPRPGLFNSTVAVLGFGDIGQTVAQRVKDFGADVLVVKRTMCEKPTYVDKIYLTDQLLTVLKLADYVILTLPSTPATQGIIGEAELKIMNDNAFLVNIGRGSLIDQAALIRALKTDSIAGAGLDVTTPEPLPVDSELWDLDNVILTSHSSGFEPGNDSRRYQLFKHNLLKYLAGEPLNNQVSFNLKY
ncbi:D-2-hydroxyacid dehydrogenase [Halanaerobium salsuginis]|jgi:phosphoglycerate dehydrogenase-like enzyme|uniref:Phosphoglycerate dehydrogenase n=1 Tax=Halanaerobium salsuginis TaxID=29563 RepID=A0A1I4I8U1_9FIRM|nr:D-2-hydroxyacid dehydrogenase [Halanaerobium salsuginis]SFL50705.1 Phosphoglycerate dehydrogenase [Halanaerobium salsuginis]